MLLLLVYKNMYIGYDVLYNYLLDFHEKNLRIKQVEYLWVKCIKHVKHVKFELSMLNGVIE